MSQENVEVARAFFDAWNAGDMDAVREMHAPDATLRTVENWPEPGPYIGRDAVMRFFEHIRDAWDADAGEPITDFIDAADHVVVRFVWRGAGQGPESNMEFTGVGTLTSTPLCRPRPTCRPARKTCSPCPRISVTSNEKGSHAPSQRANTSVLVTADLALAYRKDDTGGSRCSGIGHGSRAERVATTCARCAIAGSS
jgi:ketosteroid isomerase-like protein